MLKVRPLKPGGTIGIFAPGSPTRSEYVTAGIQYLEKLGYKIVMPLDPSKHYGRTDGEFASASIAERLSAFSELLANEQVDVVLAARGAYGTIELLPFLDYAQIGVAQKAIVGFSDVTLLVSTVPQYSRLAAIHGPTLTGDFGQTDQSPDSKESVESLIKLLSDPNYRYASSVQPIRAGAGEGELLVGNLSMLITLLGSPWDIDYSGRVLVIEDAGEAPYRIHRMLMQLLHAGKLDELAALVFGRFSKCEAKSPPDLPTVLARFVQEHLKELDYPVVAGLSSGHDGKNIALPVGIRARVESTQFQVLESPLDFE